MRNVHAVCLVGEVRGAGAQLTMIFSFVRTDQYSFHFGLPVPSSSLRWKCGPFLCRCSGVCVGGRSAQSAAS